MLPVVLSLLLHAQPATAVEWFQRGRTQARENRYAEALISFRQAQALEPSLGTLLNLADCHEKLGHDLEAWYQFSEALAWARREQQADRITLAETRLTALEKWLARVEMQPAQADVQLRVNGLTQPPRKAMAVAVGQVTVDAQAPGREPWQGTFEVRAGQLLVVAVPELAPLRVMGPRDAPRQPEPPSLPLPVENPADPRVPASQPPQPPPPPARVGPVVLLASGAAVAVAGTGLLLAGLEARGRWNTEVSLGVPLERRSVPIATFELTTWGIPAAAALAGVGALMVGGAAWWWQTPPAAAGHAVRVSPVLFATGLGLVLSLD